jgi:hypothetical protein
MSRGDIVAPIQQRLLIGCGSSGGGRRPGHVTESRVGHDERRLAALGAYLQPQQVATRGQVGQRVVLDEVFIVLVDERGEGDEVERTVGRDEDCRVPPSGLHNWLAG